MRKLFLLILLAAIFLAVPAPARAETGALNKIPELNPLCWQKEDCARARKQITEGLSDTEAAGGWLSGPGAGLCAKNGSNGEPLWGKCLPMGKTVTSISFGGKRDFANIGQFILTIYNYGISVAGLVAVIVIIFAGAQWVASGGNSEMIASSKKRIGGAMVGLLIAFFSYAILNTINPALVNLRLPQVYMIRSQSIVPEYCSELPTSTSKFALVGPSNTQMETFDFSKLPEFDFDFDANKNEWSNNKNRSQKLVCNKKFVVKDGGEVTCEGDWCESSDNICIPSEKGKGQYECVQGNIYGQISYSPPPLYQALALGDGWDVEEPVDIDATELLAICYNYDFGNTGWQEIDGTISEESKNRYIFAASAIALKEGEEDCASVGGLKGYVLALEMNEWRDPIDELHFVGLSSGEAIDLGTPSVKSSGILDSLYIKDEIRTIKQEYFIPHSSIVNGLRLNINAARIHDIDDEPAERNLYKSLY